MSSDAGRIEPQFVYPGDAVPLGIRPTDDVDLPAIVKRRGQDRRRAFSQRTLKNASARRSTRLRRCFPIAIAALAGLVFVGLTDGGRHAREAAPVDIYLGKFLERIGLGLSEVTVAGQRMTRDAQIYDQLQLNQRRSIWLLDTEAARKRVETLPWILKASVKRVFPDRLLIDVVERVPRVLWNDGQRTVLLDASGRVLGDAGKQAYASLPTVFGPGAAPQANAILEMVGRTATLRDRVRLYEWTANRRWTLHLKSGRKILLPVDGVGLALIQLGKGGRGERLLNSNFETLDMRLKEHVAIEFRE